MPHHPRPLLLLLLGLSAWLAEGATPAYSSALRETCQLVRQCNGILCSDTCATGTVQVDPWATEALNIQRTLQREKNQPLVKYQMPGTHNSAITMANGFGIEMDFIEALLGENLYQGDDIGEGVSQRLSITDQLRLGLRHIELDINWDFLHHDILLCHSPFPLDPVTIAKVEAAAQARGLDLGWDIDKLSCLGTKRTFNESLREVKAWMDQNPNEVVILYLDTKFDPFPPAAEQGNRDILGVFGDMVYRVNSGSPLNKTVKSLVEAGTRVIFEDHENGWLNPEHGEPLVFVPDLFVHQFGADSFIPYPNCSVEGYGNRFVRALDGSFPEAATACGVNVVSGNYWQSDLQKLFVWSFAETTNLSKQGCVATLSHGRWDIQDCAQEKRMACMGKNDTDWVLSLKPASWDASHLLCPAGYLPDVPTNGYANSRLHTAALSESIWVDLQMPLQF